MHATPAPEREHWASKISFVFAAIGSAIGLGNVWRFPRVCAENGGFAFLIVFVLALFTTGIPILILELAIGERTQKATPGAMRSVGRRYEWFGWFIVMIGFFITCYYAIVMSWCWNYVPFSLAQAWGPDPKGFFYGDFLQVSDPALLPGGWGGFSWPVFFGSLIAWAGIMACIWKGVKTMSKVALPIVCLPWILLVVFVIRGVTLPGAATGLEYYLLPKGDWLAFLFKPDTWIQAYTQVFFSLSIGFGIMIAYGSFLTRETDIVKNAFIIAFSDVLTAFVAGLAVFACLGHLAEGDNGIPISDWMDSSFGIAFVAYPTLISSIKGGFILGALFFLMLLMLATSSAFSLVEASVAPLEDKFGWSHKKAMFSVCALGFCLGIPFMFHSGIFWFDTLDHFMNHFGLVLACLFECIIVGYVYSTDRVRRELLEHRENRLGAWWGWMIRYVTPVILLALLGWEITKRFLGPYPLAMEDPTGPAGGYGRAVEFLAGWLALLLAAAVALVLTLAPGKQSGREQ